MKNLFYQEFGPNTDKAEAVILLHGLFGMSDNLTRLAKELSIDHWVIVPDLINHGRSPHRMDMGYPAMAQDIFYLMDALKIESAKLMGHSMGGKVAMQMAGSLPLRVDKLVVADIAPVKYPPSHNAIITVMKEIAAASISTRREADQLLSAVVEEAMLRQFFLKSLKRKDDGYWEWCLGVDEISDAYSLICDKPELSTKYIRPTLFIKGSDSDYINDRCSNEVKHWFPLADLQIIQGAGHWLHAEKPVIFNRLVSTFFKE